MAFEALAGKDFVDAAAYSHDQSKGTNTVGWYSANKLVHSYSGHITEVNKLLVNSAVHRDAV